MGGGSGESASRRRARDILRWAAAVFTVSVGGEESDFVDVLRGGGDGGRPGERGGCGGRAGCSDAIDGDDGRGV